MSKEGKNISGFVHFLSGEREVEENEVHEGWRWKRVDEKDSIDSLHEYIMRYVRIVCEEEQKTRKRRKETKVIIKKMKHYLMIVKKEYRRGI